tara:strand:- start:153 stop:497 length:345 start_codon:yes stop_codon:yes gene_type:complete
MEKLLKDYWKGKIPLVKSYWIGCVLTPIVLIIPILPALGDGDVSDGYAIFAVIWWIFLFFTNFFLLIGGFNSASVYIKNKRKKRQGAGWGIIAQILIVIGGISIILQYFGVLLA